MQGKFRAAEYLTQALGGSIEERKQIQEFTTGLGATRYDKKYVKEEASTSDMRSSPNLATTSNLNTNTNNFGSNVNYFGDSNNYTVNQEQNVTVYEKSVRSFQEISLTSPLQAEVERTQSLNDLKAANDESLKNEVEIIMQSLQMPAERKFDEGWQYDSNLPKGWKFRNSQDSNEEYLNESQVHFKSTSEASKHIQNNLTKGDWDRFSLFYLARVQEKEQQKIKQELTTLDETALETLMVKEEQIEIDPLNPGTAVESVYTDGVEFSSTLPPGWSVTSTGLLQPPPSLLLGFQNRRTAFQALALSGSSSVEAQVCIFFRCLRIILL